MTSLADLVNGLCGVYLDDSKAYLVEHRLSEVARRAQCPTLGDLVRRASMPGEMSLRNELIDAITTHETLFFRDQSPFEALQFKVLPELFDAQSNSAFGPRLRVWSAACSTGQETYSLAMCIMETLGDATGWDIQILGTDVSAGAVAQAMRGEYAVLDVERGLSAQRRERWFEPIPNGWRVGPELRRLCRFEQRNLLASFPERDTFHVVMCRNVAIYFERDVRREMFQRMIGTMAPTGYLFVGASENLADCGPEFKAEMHCRSVFYRPRLVNNPISLQ
ncbi:MAG: protein-glutamate O-methyltransferase CheR [Planctomycetales bacterium]|nr:protein-glutamate O-methyltransferase CheR [Planctomycetales bacterium]